MHCYDYVIPDTFKLTYASSSDIFTNIFITAIYECMIYNSNYDIATGHTTMQDCDKAKRDSD